MTRSKRNRSYSTTSGSNMPGNKHRPKHNDAKRAASPSSKKKKGNKSTKKTTAVDNAMGFQHLTPLQAFFARYPSFNYDKNSSAASEFYRLCDKFGWEKGQPKREKAFKGYKKALSIQFNKVYGTNANGLPEWQRLCDEIGIDPVPMDITACKEAVRNAHVNLIDVVDKKNTGMHVRKFPSEEALSDYTKDTGKFFPLDQAHAGGLLRYLLRHILHPRRDEADI